MSHRQNDVFQKAGKRSTTQRRLIFNVLEGGAGHLDAEAVHDRVKAYAPRISLATVYRSLSILREMGLIEQHYLGEDHGHYEAVRNDPHYHFTCLGCGDVLEFGAPEVSGVARRLNGREGVKVTKIQLSMVGFCAKCGEKAESRGSVNSRG